MKNRQILFGTQKKKMTPKMNNSKHFIERLLIMVIIVFTAGNAYAQKVRQSVNINCAFGQDNYTRKGITSGLGDHRYKGSDFKGMEIGYSRSIAGNIDFCTGLSATIADLELASTAFQPGGSSTSVNRDEIFVFSIPAHLKFHFLKYLFFEGGINLNYHPSKSYTWGAGLSAAIGAEYEFHSGITLFASPFGQWNCLNLGIGNEQKMGSLLTYTPGRDVLSLKGIKIGVGYKF
jgi:hypothetical protein